MDYIQPKPTSKTTFVAFSSIWQTCFLGDKIKGDTFEEVQQKVNSRMASDLKIQEWQKSQGLPEIPVPTWSIYQHDDNWTLVKE